MNKQKLQRILEDHRKWVNCEIGGICAELENADLRNADLRGAILRGADLRGADLSYANLICANLSNADLRGAKLCYASLGGANLHGADLRNADLRGANLICANLSCADLDKSESIRKGLIVQKKMIGWKKCRDKVIVKLEIPKGAIVFSINNGKCRTNIAKAVEIIGGDGETAVSCRNGSFVYRLNKTVTVADFDCQYNEECSTGIHFFRTREEAEEYV